MMFDIEQLTQLPHSEIVKIQNKATEILGKKKTRICGACGECGHNKSNKLCPKYEDTKRERKREKKRERKREKEERKRAKKRQASGIEFDFDQFRYHAANADDNDNDTNISIILNGEEIYHAGDDDGREEREAEVTGNIYFQESKIDATQEAYLKTNQAQCLICLQEFKINQSVVRMNCLCLYHSDCAYAWWDKSENISCPAHAYLKNDEDE